MPATAAILVQPRKRPRQRRAEATVEAILEAAGQLVAQRGLAGFNTNAVAERGGSVLAASISITQARMRSWQR